MTINSLRLTTQANERRDPCERTAGSLRFDMAVALLSVWLTAGTFLDGFAHHNLPETLETFFTPWHAVLYSGFTAVAGLLVFQYARNIGRGYAWNRAVPAGYTLALLGVPLFIAAGVGDFIWHELFGFETGVEALFSPTHLMLAAGGVLLFSGPLRAAWRRSSVSAAARWATHLPAVLSMLLILSAFTFFTDYANTFSSPDLLVEAGEFSGDATADALFQFHRQVQGVAGLLIPMALLMGVVLLGIRQRALPPGGLTLLVIGNSLLMAGFHFAEVSAYPQVLAAALAGGLVADAALRWLKPSVERVRELRVFAFVVPFALSLFFFAVLIGTTGIWWSIHVWTGVVFLSGIVGLLLSYVAVPPLRRE